MVVRVVRLMEYTYPDVDAALADMSHWAVQGARRFRFGHEIRSSVILNPTQYDAPVEPTKYATVKAGEGTVEIVRSALLRCPELDPHEFHYWELKKHHGYNAPLGTYICAVEVLDR